MNFLTAHKLVKSFVSGPELGLRLAMSGETENLSLFLQAHAATRGFLCRQQAIPFNTLQQFVRQESFDEVKNVFVLLPWDFLPPLDWRTGFSRDEFSPAASLASIRDTAALLGNVPNAGFVYIDAPIPPIAADGNANEKLRTHLRSAALELGARVYPETAFALASYLTHGTPIASSHVSLLSETVIELAVGKTRPSAKILATDLDNVMWRGVIGEDGVDNIHFGPTGAGYRHFLYQTYLKRLQSQGVVLIAVSRNDTELANLPFTTDRMTLKTDDFVSIVASYNAKSAQLEQIAKELNLGLDAIVFVDDNPLEIAEVREQLEQVNCVLFPGKDAELPDFFSTLASFFHRQSISDEDKKRTELYRTRLKSMVPSDVQGGDLTEFLKNLEMRLTIHRRHAKDFDRAVQLINKTNQFNLNGIRLAASDVIDILDNGGRLFTATLADKNGSHGEILACLIDRGGKVQAYVMSCRVFQRRVEFAFLVWLAKQQLYEQLDFMFSPTDRNIPVQQFFSDSIFSHSPGEAPSANSENIIRHHLESHQLFEVTDTAAAS
ncbi:HAD-IIIC family phosphatase [Exilibacterium tricleocarpae]|nr:HAD-IIIC family phosphatase [Exilibacterium tricleocarpae]